MRYLLFFILLHLMVSCKNQLFEINGNVANNSLNDKYIYLQRLDDNRLITFDSVIIKDKKFKFKGKIQSPQFAEITIEKKDSLNFSPAIFILEPGKMEAYIDSFSYVRGGVVNNNLAEYYAQSYYYEQKSDYLKQQKLIDGNKINDSLAIALDDLRVLYEKEKIAYALRFIDMNNNNLGGVLVFLQNISYFSIEEVRNILFYAGPVFRENKDVKILEDYLNKGDTTNMTSPL